MTNRTVVSEPIHVSAVKYNKPVGKRYSVSKDGELVKGEMGNRSDKAEAICKTFESPNDYFVWLESLDPHYMQLSGTFTDQTDGKIVRLKDRAEFDELSATNSFLKFRRQAGVLLIDVDVKTLDEVEALWPNDLKPISSPERLRQILIELAPSFALAAMRIKGSSSSNLYVDGIQKTGVLGLHAEVIIDDASRIPEILNGLHDKSWCMGYGWGFVSKGGQILERSIIDKAMARPAQPFFGELHITDKRIENRNDSVYFSGEALSSTKALDELKLNKDERLQLDTALGQMRRALADSSTEARKELAKTNANDLSKQLNLSEEEAYEILLRASGGILPYQFPIVTTDGESIQAADLWGNKERFDGCMLRYPLEPDYIASTYVRYRSNGHPILISFAHGYHILGTEPPPCIVPPHFKDSIDQMLLDLKRSTQTAHPELCLDMTRLLAEFESVLQERGRERVLRLQEIGTGDMVINNYSRTDYFEHVFFPSQFILYDNFARNDIGVSEPRSPEFSRLLRDSNLSTLELKQVMKALGAYGQVFSSALQKAVVSVLTRERQVDNLSFCVDMFADKASIKRDKDGAVVTFTHEPFSEDRPVSDEFVRQVESDYLLHWPQFNEFIELLAASRFSVDRRQAFLWLHAETQFGKSMALDGVFGNGIPDDPEGRGLGLVFAIKLSEIQKALRGDPANIDPSEHFRKWIMFTDEFHSVSSELKELNNKLMAAPKNRLRGSMPLYLKVFASAESVAALVDSGVEAQLARRMSYWTGKGDIDKRQLFINNRRKYVLALQVFAARRLNYLVEYYRNLGREKASEEAGAYLSEFHRRWTIENEIGGLEDRLPEIALEFREWLVDFVQDYLERLGHGPSRVYGSSQHPSRLERLVVKSIYFGIKGAGGDANNGYDYAVTLSNYNKILELYLTQNLGKSEFHKVRLRKAELISHIGIQVKGEKHRLYDCKLDGSLKDRGGYILSDSGEKVFSNRRGLLIPVDFDPKNEKSKIVFLVHQES